ncbi:MAG: ankyrin repeat domain-containing protein, partial [Verrucomicrobia bacterium]|nr:ankyrin repeat domain-containing protein [Verrucomicrobiota bacterium]
MNRRTRLLTAAAILLLAPLAAPAGRDEDNALFSAVSRGDAAGVEKALKAGANPDARLMNGDTPLKIAERKGLTDVVKMLAGVSAPASAAAPTPAAAVPAALPEAPVPPVAMPPPAQAAPAPPVAPEAPTAPTPVVKKEPAAAPAEGLQPLLDSKALAGEYNGVVVDFLVEEGKDRLSAGQRKEALDQLVSSLKEKARVTKDEQISMSLGVLTGIGMGAARDDIVADAGANVESSYAGDWDSWIDAAFQLAHAGYTQDAADFFEFGMKHIPYPDLQARCVKGLVLARPDSAYDFLMATLNTRDTEKINPALRLLGFLASDPSLPKDKHDAIVDKLIEFTQGILHADSYGDAIFALDVAGDPRAVPALSRLKKGMAVGSEVKRAALRSLLLTYKDMSVIETLKGMTRGGLMTLNNPWDNFYAGSLLIEAGDDAGFVWSQKQLAQVRKSFMSSDTDPELRPDIVRVLVKHGGKRGGKVLAETV